MGETKTVQLGFRVHPEKAKLLGELSISTDRPRSWLLEQALDSYLETQAWQIAHIEEGLADADAGHMVSHERIREWLVTWGSENEGEPPA
ncbi:MAG: CopG family ribbon-helix-helix protein [Proteobacteria bacterium]|nr:CopG family ribbon-helix-helix protein [Pseudomonadota bacterium]